MENTDNKKRGLAITPQNQNDTTARAGLWWGLSAAAVVTTGVLALAFYTDYKSNQQDADNGNGVTVVSGSIPSTENEAAQIAVQTTDIQVQGMIAPADNGEEVAEIASAPLAASEVAASAPASSPADFILNSQNNSDDAAKVIAENGVVKFYFASGKAELAANATEALRDIVAGVQEGKQAVVSGYADSTGNAQANEQLSKQRAFQVRDALLAAGVPERAIIMEKPQNSTGSGNADEARRVEVILR